MEKVTRRHFFKKTAALTGAAATVYSWEEFHLLAMQQGQGGTPAAAEGSAPQAGGRSSAEPIPIIPGPIPTFKLGGLQVSRLIAGHNLLVGQAHSTGAIYSSALLKAYFTEAKILETFASYEKNGINTSGLRMQADIVAIAKKYKAQGGKLMWLAGISSQPDGSGGPGLDMALDLGCQLAYVHGNTSDRFMREKNIGMIGKALENIRKAGLVAGVCSHSIEVPMLCEKEGIKPSFYIKTFNSGNYWTAGPPIEPDPKWKPTEIELAQPEFGSLGGHGGGLWDANPKALAAFMQNVKVPWIGFKILGAGAISPRESFAYCFKNGCDGYLVGQFDFQVADNANLTKQLLRDKDKLGRIRPWVES